MEADQEDESLPGFATMGERRLYRHVVRNGVAVDINSVLARKRGDVARQGAVRRDSAGQSITLDGEERRHESAINLNHMSTRLHVRKQVLVGAFAGILMSWYTWYNLYTRRG